MQVDERVGVLLVHGIGEQKRFQHLEAEVRSLASAIDHTYGRAGGRTTVQITPGASSTLQADKESWRCDRRPPVQLLLRKADGKTISICFHEVWWADLDEPATIKTQIKFWFWGLSMWAVAGRFRALPAGFQQMRLAGRQGYCPGLASRLWLRARLLLVATVFAAATATVSLWNFFARRLGFGYFPGSRAFVNYVGDLKLYRQETRADRGPLYDLDQPPRVSIRRRMVAGIVDVATAGYDRWYILAHSLGSIVAFNALMEPAHCLPNYIDPQRWSRLGRQGMAGPGRTGPDGKPKDWLADVVRSVATMMPRRPVWLSDDDVIYREQLFAGLRGFLTYGSPLDKFASIWPALVPLNQVEAVFDPRCEWINVTDPCDPVAGHLDFFEPIMIEDPDGRRALKVENYGYRVSPWVLRTHTRYLHFSPRRAGGMVHSVAEWLVQGSKFSEVRRAKNRWFDPKGLAYRVRESWRLAQWILIGVGVSAASVVLLGPVLQGLGEYVGSLPGPISDFGQVIVHLVGAAFAGGLLRDSLVVFLLGVMVCLVCGAARYMLVPEEHDPNGRKPGHERMIAPPPEHPSSTSPDLKKAA